MLKRAFMSNFKVLRLNTHHAGEKARCRHQQLSGSTANIYRLTTFGKTFYLSLDLMGLIDLPCKNKAHNGLIIITNTVAILSLLEEVPNIKIA